MRAELQPPWAVSVSGGAFVLASYVFGTFGEVHLENPTVSETPTVHAVSYGVGLRLGGAQDGARL